MFKNTICSIVQIHNSGRQRSVRTQQSIEKVKILVCENLSQLVTVNSEQVLLFASTTAEIQSLVDWTLKLSLEDQSIIY